MSSERVGRKDVKQEAYEPRWSYAGFLISIYATIQQAAARPTSERQISLLLDLLAVGLFGMTTVFSSESFLAMKICESVAQGMSRLHDET